MTNQKSHNKRNAMIAIGVAAAAGYVAGILLAPKSGRELREDIKEETEKATKKIATTAKNAEKTAADDIHNVLTRIDEIGKAVRNLSTTVKK